MPKVKTRKAVSKRFKITGTGKVLSRKSKTRHLLTCKTKKKKRAARHVAVVCDAEARNVKAMMPYG